MSPARARALLWLARRLAGLGLAAGLAVHLVQAGGGGGPALLARLGESAGWQAFYAAVVGLAVIHGGLGVRDIWRERGHGLAVPLVRRRTGLALLALVPVHVLAALVLLAFPALAAQAFTLAQTPLHRWLEAAAVALVAGHAFGGLRVLALDIGLWSRAQGVLGWLAAGLTAAAALAVLV